MTRRGALAGMLFEWAAAVAFATPAAAAAPADVDTLSVESVLQRRNARLDSLLLPESTSFDTVGVSAVTDSLDRGGAAAVRSHHVESKRPRGRALRLGLDPLALSSYNRIEGTRLGMGLQPLKLPMLSADVAAAYGTANHRWSGRAGIAFHERHGPSAQFRWSELVVPFGPNPAEQSSGFLALVAGQDRQDYLRRRDLELSIHPWESPEHGLALRLFDRRESSVAAATDFSVFGGHLPIDAPNPAIDAGRTRGASLQGHLGKPRGAAEVAAEVGVTGAGGDFDYSWQSGRATLRHIFSDGGVASLAVEGLNVGGTPPVQAVAYLGGDANLRGFERLEFAGRQRASARVEYALGIDLLQRARLPLLDRLHVQFIPFADTGTTWGTVRGVARSRGTLDGELRSSFGLGLQRTLWLPGFAVVRLDITHRTDGRGDGLTFWFRPVPLDL